MSLPGRLISHRQGTEGGRGGAGDGDDRGLSARRPTHVSCEVGAKLTNTNHVYQSVHMTVGGWPRWSGTLAA